MTFCASRFWKFLIIFIGNKNKVLYGLGTAPFLSFILLFKLTNHQFYDIISTVPQSWHPESTDTVAVHPQTKTGMQILLPPR